MFCVHIGPISMCDSTICTLSYPSFHAVCFKSFFCHVFIFIPTLCSSTTNPVLPRMVRSYTFLSNAPYHNVYLTFSLYSGLWSLLPSKGCAISHHSGLPNSSSPSDTLRYQWIRRRSSPIRARSTSIPRYSV